MSHSIENNELNTNLQKRNQPTITTCTIYLANLINLHYSETQ